MNFRLGSGERWWTESDRVLLHDTLDGTHGWLKGAPLGVSPVFALLQQVLAPPVVRILVEDPGALLDVGRVDVPVTPAVLQVGHVFTEFQHLAAEVWPLVDAHPVSGGGLEW